jgi:hypothetical protein
MLKNRRAFARQREDRERPSNGEWKYRAMKRYLKRMLSMSTLES